LQMRYTYNVCRLTRSATAACCIRAIRLFLRSLKVKRIYRVNENIISEKQWNGTHSEHSSLVIVVEIRLTQHFYATGWW
jgi:hypothetical protein